MTFAAIASLVENRPVNRPVQWKSRPAADSKDFMSITVLISVGVTHYK